MREGGGLQVGGDGRELGLHPLGGNGAVVESGSYGPAVVRDGVIAAPEYQIFAREAEEVKAIAVLGGTVAALSADPRPVLQGQWPGHQDMIVNRDKPGAKPTRELAAPALGCQDQAPGSHRAPRRDPLYAVLLHNKPLDSGPLPDRRPLLLGDALQPPDQADSVEQNGFGAVDHGPDKRRVQACSVRGLIQRPGAGHLPGALRELLPQFLRRLRVGGQLEDPGALQVAPDSVPGDEVQELRVLGPPEPLQLLDLRGEVPLSVGMAMGEAGFAESTVPSARAVSHRRLLQDRHFKRGSSAAQLQRRPEAGESPSDHAIPTLQSPDRGLARWCQSWFNQKPGPRSAPSRCPAVSDRCVMGVLSG